VLDAGVKALGMDQGDPVLLTMEGKKIEGRVEVNEEHLKLFGASEELPIGSKVKLIPGHCCSTVNLYDKLYLFEEDTVTDRLFISDRGCSR
jgi:D-serine deaminase-like pyridoxal phosphate-dependent protein